jgi:hypothetical protein
LKVIEKWGVGRKEYNESKVYSQYTFPTHSRNTLRNPFEH